MTVAEKSPSEIARDTLKLLLTRRLAPTPANFRLVYHEVAGTPDEPPFPLEPLRHIAHALPARTALHLRQKSALDEALGRRDWHLLQNALVAYANALAAAPAAAPVAAAPAAAGAVARPEPSVGELLEQVARLVETLLPAFAEGDANLSGQAAGLLAALRESRLGLSAIRPLLGNFTLRASFAAEDQAEVRATLLKLLQLIIDNIGELSREDRWLKKQVDALREAANPPLSLRRLDDVERRLKDVLFKQTMAKGRQLEAEEEMRRLLASFVERLSQMTESTSAHHERMEAHARRIGEATRLEEVAPLLKDVVATTRSIALEVKHTHDELDAMRTKVRATEEEIARLRDDLDHANAQARHDALTGALNRKGLDEALAREVAEVRRKDSPLCVALLDIDNFKRLNETRGHAAGDAALTHLAGVTRDSLRPQDTLARYGGEEFVILMPDTALEPGIEAMTRLQRALTRRFFLAGNEKVVITFSAGVAQLCPGETPPDAIARADQAMYLAKRAGKNRVVGA